MLRQDDPDVQTGQLVCGGVLLAVILGGLLISGADASPLGLVRAAAGVGVVSLALGGAWKWWTTF
jgi:hypothetical protein